MKASLLLAAAAAAGIALAAPAHADPDVDFNEELHSYGIYMPRDESAYLGKIVCDRLGSGLDKDAYKSAAFLTKNLHRTNTTQQNWQFLSASINNYCPDQQSVLQQAASHT